MSFEEHVLTQIVQISILTTIVWIVTNTVAKRQAQLCYALWLVVLLKCVTPPVWSSPVSIFRWLQTDVSSMRRSGSNMESRAVGAVNRPTSNPMGSTPVPKSTHWPSPSEVMNVSHGTGQPTAAIEEAPPAFTLPRNVKDAAAKQRETLLTRKNAIDGYAQPTLRVALWGWLGIAMILMATTLVRGGCFVGGLLRSAVDHPPLHKLNTELCQRLRLKRRVRLVVTRRPVGPAVVGLWRPVVVLPQFLVQERTLAEMKPMLAHELVHIRRGDLWVGLFRHCVRSLWWFHPFVWKTSTAVRQGAERCCDEEVIDALNISPRAYADMLLAVLERKQELRAVPFVPGVRPFDIHVYSIGENYAISTRKSRQFASLVLDHRVLGRSGQPSGCHGWRWNSFGTSGGSRK